MSKGERAALIVPVAIAVLLSVPMAYVQLLVWKEEGHDHMLTAANLCLSCALWLILAFAVWRNLKDANRSDRKDAALTTVRDEYQTQVYKLNKGQADLARRLGESEGRFTNLQQAAAKTEMELRDARIAFQKLEADPPVNHEKVRVLVERERQENLFLKAKVSTLEHEMAEMAEQYGAPLVLVERYVHGTMANSEIVVVNDGKTEAYDVRIEAEFDGFKLELRNITRLAIRAEHHCPVLITGKNNSPDLDWIVGLWQKQFMKETPDGLAVEAPPILVAVRYKDGIGRAYRTECELTRDIYQEKGAGINFRFVRRVPDDSRLTDT